MHFSENVNVLFDVSNVFYVVFTPGSDHGRYSTF